MDDALHTAERMVEALVQTFRLARALSAAQREVDLDGLADQVGFVCARAMDLPPEAGRQLRPRFLMLLAEVDAVSIALRNQDDPSRQKADPCLSLPPPS